ncbi:MAG TPA: monovalent cation/H(+) antiporter subunit G [Bacillota bacterium]|nr:monovalent cation/H(+) antiporter subunit G [Bacillota bacterium]
MIVSEIFKYIGIAFIVIGSLTSIVSAIGLIRFPDVYSRAHAATKTTTVAVLITLVGIFIYYIAAESFVSIRIILAIVFVFLTAPVSGHLILRASYRAKVKLADSSIKDELHDYFTNKQNREE